MQTVWMEAKPRPATARSWTLPLHISPSAPRGGYFLLPEEVAAWLGKAKPPVWAVFDQKVTYRGTLVRYGTPYLMLLLRSELREALGSPPEGALIEVTLWMDDEPRTVTLPEPLRRLLEAEPAAMAAFQRLSFTRQNELVRGIADAKKHDTLDRRLLAAMAELRST